MHTTESPWFIERLSRLGITTVVPDDVDRKLLDRVIFEELNDGVVKEESKAAMRQMVLHMKTMGARGIVLGCTELRLLVEQDSSGYPLPIGGLPLFDTAKNHCEAAVDFALSAKVHNDSNVRP